MRHCYILRVFTREGGGGNPLGVVTDVTGLDDADMQEIARDLGFSETVFVDWRDGGTPTTRIFTPSTEIPFAGHPLVGAAWVLTVAGPGCDRVACGIGQVELRREGDEVWIAPPSDFPTGPARIDLGSWASPVEATTVRMPLAYHLVRLADASEVASLTSPSPTVDGELFAWAWEEEGRVARARFFAPAVGVPEDAATGSAAVALAAALMAGGRQSGEVVIHQGEEVGSPSLIRLRWSPGEISVGGLVSHDETRVLEV